MFAQSAQIRTADLLFNRISIVFPFSNSTEDSFTANGTVNQSNDFDDDSCEDAREEAPPSNTKKVQNLFILFKEIHRTHFY